MSEKDMIDVKAGEDIIKAGEKADKAYMIVEGAAHVYLEQNGRTVELSQLKKGAIFGESALFGIDSEYGANVAATENSTLLVITPENFKSRMKGCDPMIKELVRMLIERQRQTNETLLKRETQGYIDIDLV